MAFVLVHSLLLLWRSYDSLAHLALLKQVFSRASFKVRRHSGISPVRRGAFFLIFCFLCREIYRLGRNLRTETRLQLYFMSMWKKFASLFVVMDEATSSVHLSSQANADKVPSPPRSVPPPTSAVSQGTVSEKFLEVLFGAIEKANQEGFDYLEFRKSLQSLKGMAMDEPTRFKSAFAMAQSMGTTVDHLRASAQYYLNVLRQEEQKFGEALKHQQAQQVEAKKNQIVALDDNIKSREAQIVALQQEMASFQQQRRDLEQQIAQATENIAGIQRDFMASFQQVVGQIEDDAAAMEQFLQ